MKLTLTNGTIDPMAGRWFDEWQVGDRIEHPIRRTVTETDNLLFSTLTHNTQPLHIDAEAAKASEFGQILVNGTFTFSLMIGISVGETTLGDAGRQSRLRQAGHAQAGLPRRYAADRERSGGAEVRANRAPDRRGSSRSRIARSTSATRWCARACGWR
jgi:hypothetical protein